MIRKESYLINLIKKKKKKVKQFCVKKPAWTLKALFVCLFVCPPSIANESKYWWSDKVEVSLKCVIGVHSEHNKDTTVRQGVQQDQQETSQFNSSTGRDELLLFSGAEFLKPGGGVREDELLSALKAADVTNGFTPYNPLVSSPVTVLMMGGEMGDMGSILCFFGFCSCW